MAERKQAQRQAPKADRVPVTITLNRFFLEKLEAMGAEIGRNRSEMIDRAVEEFVVQRMSALRPPSTPPAPSRR